MYIPTQNDLLTLVGLPRQVELVAHPKMDTPCWIWTGHKNQDGYGIMSLNGHALLVHRVMYYFFVGDTRGLPDSCILHKCDVTSCCNPSHLFSGTKAENALDCKAKGRTARGSKLPQARISEDKVYALRCEYADGASIKDLAEREQYAFSAMYSLLIGRRWTHVPHPPNRRTPKCQ